MEVNELAVFHERQEQFRREQEEKLASLNGKVFEPAANAVAERTTFSGLLWFLVVVLLALHALDTFL